MTVMFLAKDKFLVQLFIESGQWQIHLGTEAEQRYKLRIFINGETMSHMKR